MDALQLLENPPNFFLIGAERSGTTRLFHLLGQHPDIFVSPHKEPEFFSHPNPPPERVAGYAALFDGGKGKRAVGEASTFYSRCTLCPGTAKRIYDFNSRAKIIYIVRHPLRRLESGWVQTSNNVPGIARDFRVALRTPTNDILDVSRYWKQLCQYRAHFPDDQILLLFFEEFIADEAATIRRCHEFLGVAPDATTDFALDQRRNSSSHKRRQRRLFALMRRQRGFTRVRAHLPLRWKQRLRPLLMEPIPKPTWDEETWKWAATELQPDAAQLLAHAGKPADFWSFDFPATG